MNVLKYVLKFALMHLMITDSNLALSETAMYSSAGMGIESVPTSKLGGKEVGTAIALELGGKLYQTLRLFVRTIGSDFVTDQQKSYLLTTTVGVGAEVGFIEHLHFSLAGGSYDRTYDEGDDRNHDKGQIAELGLHKEWLVNSHCFFSWSMIVRRLDQKTRDTSEYANRLEFSRMTTVALTFNL
jgi:hypothetical protein